MEEVVDVSAVWYDLGLQLKVRTADLNSIRAQIGTPNCRIQLREMLNVWLTTGDDPCWEALIDALRSRSVGANQLAGILKQKWCLVEETEVNRCMSAPYFLPATNVPPPPVSESVVPTLQPWVTEMQGSKWKCVWPWVYHEHIPPLLELKFMRPHTASCLFSGVDYYVRRVQQLPQKWSTVEEKSLSYEAEVLSFFLLSFRLLRTNLCHFA